MTATSENAVRKKEFSSNLRALQINSCIVGVEIRKQISLDLISIDLGTQGPINDHYKGNPLLLKYITQIKTALDAAKTSDRHEDQEFHKNGARQVKALIEKLNASSAQKLADTAGPATQTTSRAKEKLEDAENEIYYLRRQLQEKNTAMELQKQEMNARQQRINETEQRALLLQLRLQETQVNNRELELELNGAKARILFLEGENKQLYSSYQALMVEHRQLDENAATLNRMLQQFRQTASSGV